MPPTKSPRNRSATTPRSPRPGRAGPKGRGSMPAAPKRTAAKSKPRPHPKPKPRPATPAGPLTPTQRRYLRGLCHALNPVILLGAKGVTEAVAKELGVALDRHELVKIKLSGGDRAERTQQLEALLGATGAEAVQQIGHTASVFRRNVDEPKLALPR